MGWPVVAGPGAGRDAVSGDPQAHEPHRADPEGERPPCESLRNSRLWVGPRAFLRFRYRVLLT